MDRRTETYTGRMVDALDLKPDDICIEDIAHHLSMQCRYNGACRVFYSVAQHSCQVSLFVELHLDGNSEEQFAALMHDAAETYLHDLVAPHKHGTAMGALYSEIEDRAMKVIAGVFGFSWPKPEKVKLADEVLGWLEADSLMASRGRTWSGYETTAREWIEADSGKFLWQTKRQPFYPQEAESIFLEQFATLKPSEQEVPA